MLEYIWVVGFEAATITWKGRDVCTLVRLPRDTASGEGTWYLIGNAGYKRFSSEGEARAWVRRGIDKAQERVRTVIESEARDAC